MLGQMIEFVFFSTLALAVAFFGLGYNHPMLSSFIYLPILALFFIYASLIGRDARHQSDDSY
jgi:hypothetical protein